MKVRPPRDGGTRTNHPAASRVVAALLGFLLAIALSSCSLFVTPPPPESVATAATALRDTLRETLSITEVTVTVAPRDEKDGGSLDNPGAWLITANVTAQSSTIDVHPLVLAIDDELDTARRIAPATATLQLTGDGLPDTTLDFFRGDSHVTVTDVVDAVVRLRALTEVQAVHVSFGGPRPDVTVSSPDHWPDTVTQLRALDGFGKALLTAVTIDSHGTDASRTVSSWIAVDTSTPDNATLAGMVDVARQPGITSFWYNAVRPSDSLDDWRPYLYVDSGSRSEVAAVLSRLTSFDQLAAPVSGIPRATFRVDSTIGVTGHETVGYLGLPLGAAEPDDLVAAPRPVPVPVDPAVEAAKLAANLKLVQTLLDDAGKIAGIRGTPSTWTAPCDTGAGTQVIGTVLIPIFEVTDRADAAYAAIIAKWKRLGYTTEDHAAGSEIRTGGPLKELTIQGTPDGLAVSATSHC